MKDFIHNCSENGSGIKLQCPCCQKEEMLPNLEVARLAEKVKIERLFEGVDSVLEAVGIRLAKFQ